MNPRPGIPPNPPTPKQIREIRQLAGQTQTEAAETVYVKLLAWQRWEATDTKSARQMNAAVWELYLLHCLRKGVALPSPFAQYIKKNWPQF